MLTAPVVASKIPLFTTPLASKIPPLVFIVPDQLSVLSKFTEPEVIFTIAPVPIVVLTGERIWLPVPIVMLEPVIS